MSVWENKKQVVKQKIFQIKAMYVRSYIIFVKIDIRAIPLYVVEISLSVSASEKVPAMMKVQES